MPIALKTAAISKIASKINQIDYANADDFILNCFVNLTPQSYGAKIEKRIVDKNGMKKISSVLGCGDVIDIDSLYKEIKVSISYTGAFNVVQIRPYQNFHSYLLFFFDINPDASIDRYIFEIPKNDIMQLYGVNGAHGTKESRSKNKTIEYRLSIKIGDKNWKLLTENYTCVKEF